MEAPTTTTSDRTTGDHVQSNALSAEPSTSLSMTAAGEEREFHPRWKTLDRETAVYGSQKLMRKGGLDRLKREIDVAVWNWETRRGFRHYDGGGFTGGVFLFGKGTHESKK